MFCLCKAAVCRKRRRSYTPTDRRETAWLTGASLQLFIVVKDGYEN
jgi:hypothetical protein